MKSYKVRANIDVYDNGKTDILYEIEPEVFVDEETFIKWAKEKADVLEAEVEKSKKLSKKARIKKFLKKAILEKLQKKNLPAPLVGKSKFAVDVPTNKERKEHFDYHKKYSFERQYLDDFKDKKVPDSLMPYAILLTDTIQRRLQDWPEVKKVIDTIRDNDKAGKKDYLLDVKRTVFYFLKNSEDDALLDSGLFLYDDDSSYKVGPTPTGIKDRAFFFDMIEDVAKEAQKRQEEVEKKSAEVERKEKEEQRKSLDALLSTPLAKKLIKIPSLIKALGDPSADEGSKYNPDTYWREFMTALNPYVKGEKEIKTGQVKSLSAFKDSNFPRRGRGYKFPQAVQKALAPFQLFVEEDDGDVYLAIEKST
jgi:hypothetical protein